jgi:hypothetical protein
LKIRIQSGITRDLCLKYFYPYWEYRSIVRKTLQIFLPVPIINSQATVYYKAGILTLILPKAEEAQQQVVNINLGDAVSVSDSLSEAESVKEEAAVACA